MITFKRTFIAVPVPPEEQFLSLIGAAPDNVSPLHCQDLHVTLAFLGDCDAPRCDAIWDLLRADPPPSWNARLGKPCRFGNRSAAFGYPLTVDDSFLQWLQRQRPLILKKAGMMPDPRPIRLHLTMGWQRGTEDGRIKGWLDRLQRLADSTVIFHGVAIYCRDEQGTGRRYRLIRSSVGRVAVLRGGSHLP